MMNAPDVSVVIAVKNEEIFVESAVASILAQTGVTLEVIVVDDGSTDRTFEIVSALSERHHNLSIGSNAGVGKCSAFNQGISLAKGAFCCLFAGDDIMPEGSLAVRYLAVRDAPSDKAVVGLCRLVTMAEDKKFDGHLIPRKAGRGALSGVSYLMNRPAVSKLFPVPQDLPNEDTWLEIAVTSLPDLVVIHSDVVGCAWRVHAGNSINMLVPFEEFDRKYAARMRAYGIFHHRYKTVVSEATRKRLESMIECEKQRVARNIPGILASGAGFVPRMRAVSLSGPTMYRIRAALYGLLSGW